MKKAGWAEAIVKPAISASATETWRVNGDAAADEERFSELARRTDLLVQEIVPEVATEGEWSLIYLESKFSHAAIKRPKAGDFRVQWEHGGSAEPARASKDLLARGAAIAAEIPAGWLYARIDGVVTSRGFVLMEVECIEPHLFFGFNPDSRRRLAMALARLLGQAGAR
jgi:glutathione synthase/RimK-type ligase-like ATP-grasp enzyme